MSIRPEEIVAILNKYKQGHELTYAYKEGVLNLDTLAWRSEVNDTCFVLVAMTNYRDKPDDKAYPIVLKGYNRFEAEAIAEKLLREKES